MDGADVGHRMVPDHPSPTGKRHTTPLGRDLKQPGIRFAHPLHPRQRTAVDRLSQTGLLEFAVPLVTMPTFHPSARSRANPSITSGRHRTRYGIRRRYHRHSSSTGSARAKCSRTLAKKTSRCGYPCRFKATSQSTACCPRPCAPANSAARTANAASRSTSVSSRSKSASRCTPLVRTPPPPASPETSFAGPGVIRRQADPEHRAAKARHRKPRGRPTPALGEQRPYSQILLSWVSLPIPRTVCAFIRYASRIGRYWSPSYVAIRPTHRRPEAGRGSLQSSSQMAKQTIASPPGR
ncbi:hypothetical protein SAMN04489764_1723 [Thermostaphylospora chromogena]|uniref:Uncharacterized protein n=1 Tax=Thermostaphylospora chromogena TaxID=35622 RepID=A0A1H1CYS4_9ACTN|nr:hypothetical protein SAMN04489764_1723 [Thermostaphylospora chromogena]